MTIHIYDGMAVMRRRFDNDPLGRGPRSLFLEMLNMPSRDVALWCFEGKGSLVPRRKIFPGYKDRPSSMTTGVFDLIKLCREALSHTRAFQIDVPYREADDVIAHLCAVYGVPGGDNVVVHTIDKDLKALENAHVRVDCGDLKSIQPAEIRLYKTLVGDPSDKIPGMPGFGLETYLKCDRPRLALAMHSLIQNQPQPGLFVAAGVKPGMADRICDPAQAALLYAYWQVIGFIEMPADWEDGIKPGVPNEAAGFDVLHRFHH